MLDALNPNHDQIEYWNGLAGQRWVDQQEKIDRALGPFGEAAIERLDPKLGERIIDIGCGSGDTLCAIAQRVGSSGEVTGIDASRPLLERARRRAGADVNVRFVEADASNYAFTPSFAALFSRFGVMFFADPIRAFQNLRGALQPGGRLGFVCWQSLADNAWCAVPLAAARQVLLDAPEGPEPGAPGPFAFADPRHIKHTLAAAGFTRIEVTSFHAPVVLSREGMDAAIDFTLRVGPVSRLIAEQPEQIRSSIGQRIRSALAHAATRETVTLDGAAWLVAARA